MNKGGRGLGLGNRLEEGDVCDFATADSRSNCPQRRRGDTTVGAEHRSSFFASLEYPGVNSEYPGYSEISGLIPGISGFTMTPQK